MKQHSDDPLRRASPLPMAQLSTHRDIARKWRESPLKIEKRNPGTQVPRYPGTIASREVAEEVAFTRLKKNIEEHGTVTAHLALTDPRVTEIRLQQVQNLDPPVEHRGDLSVHNHSTRKNGTTCFANFCQTEGLNYRKSITVWKLCKRSFKCDVAGHSSFIPLEMT